MSSALAQKVNEMGGVNDSYDFNRSTNFTEGRRAKVSRLEIRRDLHKSQKKLKSLSRDVSLEADDLYHDHIRSQMNSRERMRKFDTLIHQNRSEKPNLSGLEVGEPYAHSRQESGFVNIKKPFDTIELFPPN